MTAVDRRPEEDFLQSTPWLDGVGWRRSQATTSSFHEGRAPRNKGLRDPPDPPTVEEILPIPPWDRQHRDHRRRPGTTGTDDPRRPADSQTPLRNTARLQERGRASARPLITRASDQRATSRRPKVAEALARLARASTRRELPRAHRLDLRSGHLGDHRGRGGPRGNHG